MSETVHLWLEVVEVLSLGVLFWLVVQMLRRGREQTGKLSKLVDDLGTVTAGNDWRSEKILVNQMVILRRMEKIEGRLSHDAH